MKANILYPINYEKIFMPDVQLQYGNSVTMVQAAESYSPAATYTITGLNSLPTITTTDTIDINGTYFVPYTGGISTNVPNPYVGISSDIIRFDELEKKLADALLKLDYMSTLITLLTQAVELLKARTSEMDSLVSERVDASSDIINEW